MMTSTVTTNTVASKLDISTYQAQQRVDVTEVAGATGPTGGEAKHTDGEDQPHGDPGQPAHGSQPVVEP